MNLLPVYPNNILIPPVFWKKYCEDENVSKENANVLHSFQYWLLKTDNKMQYVDYLEEIIELNLI